MATESRKSLNPREVLALRGLRLPPIALENLKKVGIHCVATLSVEHQRSANRYVLRGQESGGAVADFGLYCGFVGMDGNSLPWLQRVDSLAVNGIHAWVVRAGFVRVQMVRVLRTYDLLITRHVLGTIAGKSRPALESSIIFLARQGTLELELWGKDDGLRGKVMPQFLSRAGEPTSIPRDFHDAVCRAVSGVTCMGCRHAHLLVPPIDPPAAHAKDSIDVEAGV
jgi:hypothetical protein